MIVKLFNNRYSNEDCEESVNAWIKQNEAAGLEVVKTAEVANEHRLTIVVWMSKKPLEQPAQIPLPMPAPITWPLPQSPTVVPQPPYPATVWCSNNTKS